jgi:hypothetical protein
LFKRTSPRFGRTALIAGVAACVLLALAVLAGRMTASSTAATAPTLAPVHSSSSTISLPQLSQASPLPALAAEPKVVKAPTQVPVATPIQTELPAVQPVQIQVPTIPKAPKHTSVKPVRIVGSG